MGIDGPPDLTQIAANPGRVTDLRVEDIPGVLGALEQLRAALWARMVRTPEPPVRAAADTGDELLTVTEAAAELKFTTAYVYEAVRRQQLGAVRKGKYVRIRRGDLQAWLEGRRPRTLDQGTTAPDSSPHGPSRGRASGGRTAAASVHPLRLGAPVKPPSRGGDGPR
jgi:excisionase family DNA binding protein